MSADEQAAGGADTPQSAAERLNDLEAALEKASGRLDAQSKQIDDLREELGEERDARRALQQELRESRETIEELREEISRIDERTDLLELVDDADQLDGEQRAAVLIQHLHKKAKARERRDEPASAVIDRSGAEEALHFPEELDRTTFYKDMDRAERLVGDTDLLKYSNGELCLDLEEGALPARFTKTPEVA